MPLWEASKHACAQLSGAESVEKLEFQYELGSALFPSAIAAALTNPMVSVPLHPLLLYVDTICVTLSLSTNM